MADEPAIDENATYAFDKSTGGFLRTTSKQGSYGFKGFYEGRNELTGTNPYHHDWLTMNRPGLREGSGPLKRPFKNGRGFKEPEAENLGRSDWDMEHEPADISGISNLRPSWGTPGTEFDRLGGQSAGSHRLRNVRTQAAPGTDVATADGQVPSQSFAGQGGGWARPQQVGTGRPGLPAGRAQGGRKGTQFSALMPPMGAVGGAPRAFGELGPAGSSSYTVKTNPKGQMGWDF